MYSLHEIIAELPGMASVILKLGARPPVEFPGVCLCVCLVHGPFQWESVSLALRARKVHFGQNGEYQGCGRGEGKFLEGRRLRDMSS